MNILDELGFSGRDFDHPVWTNQDWLPHSTYDLRWYAVSRCPNSVLKRRKLRKLKRIYEPKAKE